MQLGLQSDDMFIQKLNLKYKQFCDLLLLSIKNLSQISIKQVMLADHTIQKQNTFDPMKIYNFFKLMESQLINFSTNGTCTSNNDDTRRIFIKFTKSLHSYILSAHISFQYHVLLYYKPDHIISKYQTELNELSNKSKISKNNISAKGNSIIMNMLQKLGYANLTNQELFEFFFNNPHIIDKIENKIKTEEKINNQIIHQEKVLLKKLDNLLVEMYSTSPILIDEIKLTEGEDGIMCNFHLTHKKNLTLKKIPQTIQNKFLVQFDKLIYMIKNQI